MIDWITILIEAVGVAILLMWIVIPIREFRDILRVLKRKRRRESSGEDGPRA
jgi:heme exporter protein D